MGGTILVCTRCWSGYTWVGAIPSACPFCRRETSWTTMPRVDTPAVPYAITHQDRKFLTSIRIASETEAES